MLCIIQCLDTWKKLHLILACNEDHEKVFPGEPIIGFKNSKNLKSLNSKNSKNSKNLNLRALPDINEVDRCEPCSRKRPPCQLCSKMKNTRTFKSNYPNELYQIRKL